MDSTSAGKDIGGRTIRKAGLRLIPLLMLCYLVAYIDRVNIGFAALTMKADIGLSDAAFGLGAGLFFVAYVLFEIPSNLAMTKVGARRWIGRIMVTWGLVGVGTAFVTGPFSYYLARFLLGAAEAGFFPGVIFYISAWFPKSHRARVMAWFTIAVPLSSFLGSPISGALLQLQGMGGLHGWQWLFIAESIPAVLLAILIFLYLPDRPDGATWLTDSERRWIHAQLAAEGHTDQHAPQASILAILSNPIVLALALIYAANSATSNALGLWQPQIIHAFGLTTIETALVNMIPFGLGSLFMIFWAARADRTADRIRSIVLPLMLAAICFALTNVTASLAVTIALLSLALIGNFALKGPFLALAMEKLPPAQAAGGIAAINALAHIVTGLVAWLIGVVKDATGSFPIGLLVLVAVIVGAILALAWLARRSDTAPGATVRATPS